MTPPQRGPGNARPVALASSSRGRCCWPRSPSVLRLRRCPPLALALVLGVLLPCGRHASAAILENVPWGTCKVPPTVLQERVGTRREKVFSLCIKTFSGLKVTFDNADKFYIGNASSFLGETPTPTITRTLGFTKIEICVIAALLC